MTKLRDSRKPNPEEAAQGFERALAIFKERFPNHFQTVSNWPLHQASAEILRELRKAD